MEVRQVCASVCVYKFSVYTHYRKDMFCESPSSVDVATPHSHGLALDTLEVATS